MGSIAESLAHGAPGRTPVPVGVAADPGASPRGRFGEDVPDDRVVLVTGGAGFIGSNVVHHLATRGWRVVVIDNCSRPGVERNARWLTETHGPLVEIVRVDLRDRAAVAACLSRLGDTIAGVFHFAAQVAVTSSVIDPADDFAVNVAGTMHLLEALRQLPVPPPLIFTSTNKVYGRLAGLEVVRDGDRYALADPALARRGIDERQPLDFQSPYGCSKGAADQYVLEYARSFGIPATVFRMSCIYGPRQFGNEDQGWIAHFLLRAIAGRPITIFGDGRQVRDALFIDDLVRAMYMAFAELRAGTPVDPDGRTGVAGRAFNIGGGVDRVLSLRELLAMIAELHGRMPEVEWADWRPSDQRYYVSDTGAFRDATGWVPEVSSRDGLRRLYRWLLEAAIAPPAAPEAGHRVSATSVSSQPLAALRGPR